jgi:ATP-dependent DNA ligase
VAALGRYAHVDLVVALLVSLGAVAWLYAYKLRHPHTKADLVKARRDSVDKGLPEPMLARSGGSPTSGEYAYEVKWDGFRAVVSTESTLRVRSRRGWDMTEHVGFLTELPVRAVLDGELVASGPDGCPDFPLLCERMLMRRHGTAVTYMVFDLLSLDGEDLTRAQYSGRRAQLEALDLNGAHWQTPEVFDDGEALFEAVRVHELEGVVAKRRNGRYRPGQRGWIKTKNREYWRYEMERESRALTASASVRLTSKWVARRSNARRRGFRGSAMVSHPGGR